MYYMTFLGSLLGLLSHYFCYANYYYKRSIYTTSYTLWVKSLFVVTTFKTSSGQCKPVEKDKYGPTSQQTQTSYFCRGGDKPKVQMPYQTIPGQIPRKLEIERFVLLVLSYVCTMYDRSSLFYFL